MLRLNFIDVSESELIGIVYMDLFVRLGGGTRIFNFLFIFGQLGDADIFLRIWLSTLIFILNLFLKLSDRPLCVRSICVIVIIVFVHIDSFLSDIDRRGQT